MNLILDLILVVGLIYGAVDGLKIGAVKTGIHLVGWLVSIYITGIVYGPLAGLLNIFFPQSWEHFVNFLAFSFIFGIPFGVVRYFTGELDGYGNVWEFHSTRSRIGGAILGVVSGAIGNGIFIVLLALLNWGWLNDAISNSSVAPLMVDLVQALAILLPEELRWWTRVAG